MQQSLTNTKLSLTQRLKQVKTTRWVRFAVVSLLFFGWTIWLENPWVILCYPLLIDIYLTQYIPWGAWKKIKNKAIREVMNWVDAIVYALILVYFLFLFVGQNYQIPSSSLEKSLLVGDYLWVNKMVYGPRVPNTPIHFPLTQNTFPILNCKSYLDAPQWKYHRLKGLRKVQRGDIVVFNFPAGDTVALKVQNPDYYTLCNMLGRDEVWRDSERFGDVIYRPVDRRENYVKRCLGLPGEHLKIVNDVVYINGKALPQPTNVQFNYFIQTTGSLLTNQDWEALGVSLDEIMQLSDANIDAGGATSLGMRVNLDGTIPPIYHAPLTAQMIKTLKSRNDIVAVVKEPTQEVMNPYPITKDYGWTRADYASNLPNGGLYIPKKGETMTLSLDILPIYERVIKNYEGNSLEVKDGKILINGAEAKTYTFKMDYYWMMGDNRDRSADSRYWGFVPEDHVVGTPMVVLISFDKDKSIFSGGIRWNRIFMNANNDKQLF